MSIRRYTCNVRGELNPHAAGDLVKYLDHIQEVAEVRTYFINKLNAVNQIMVDAIAASNQGKKKASKEKSQVKNESATDYHGN